MSTAEVGGFPMSFVVRVDPEFPGDGVWRAPVFRFDRDGSGVPEINSRWGPPLIVEVQSSAGESWIGMFSSGGLGGARGVFGLPGGRTICAVVDGLAYIADLAGPRHSAEVVYDQVQQVVTMDSPELLLLAGLTGVVALGMSEVQWEARHIALDGLKIETVSPDAVRCRVDDLEGGTSELLLSPATGERI